MFLDDQRRVAAEVLTREGAAADVGGGGVRQRGRRRDRRRRQAEGVEIAGETARAGGVETEADDVLTRREADAGLRHVLERVPRERIGHLQLSGLVDAVDIGAELPADAL